MQESVAEASVAPIVVIGAGIVGVSCALALQRDGRQVTIIDRGLPGEGASFGNGSVISEESVLPVATPGILRRVPGMLLDPLGPLSIRWRYLPKLAPWLMRFVADSSPARVEAISIALKALTAGCIGAHERLLDLAGAPDMLKKTGWLCVYESDAGFAKFEPALELLRRREVAFDVLPSEELRQLEPALAPIFAKGVFYPDVAYSVNNFRLVQVLADAFESGGGQILRREARGFEIGPEGPRSVLTEQGPIPCSQVVVAAGAWSKELCAELGSRIPLETERGYHLTIPNPDVTPRLPVYSTERAFVCTPLENGMRVAGTVELGGLQAEPNWQRAEVLRRHVKRWFPNLNDTGTSRWMGFRPSMPDSLPVIGRAPQFRNAYLAFGHGHCGFALGPRTGEIVADLVAGRDSGLDLAPFAADRF